MCADGSGAALFYFNRAWRTDIRTDSHMITKILEIEGLPNFLRRGALLM